MVVLNLLRTFQTNLFDLGPRIPVRQKILNDPPWAGGPVMRVAQDELCRRAAQPSLVSYLRPQRLGNFGY